MYLNSLKNIFYKNEAEAITVRKGCTLEVFDDSDFSDDQVRISRLFVYLYNVESLFIGWNISTCAIINSAIAIAKNHRIVKRLKKEWTKIAKTRLLEIPTLKFVINFFSKKSKFSCPSGTGPDFWVCSKKFS